MPNQNHLVLHTVQLQGAAAWAYDGEGAAMVFGQHGSGRFVMGNLVRPFGVGDLLLLSGSPAGKFSPAEAGNCVLTWFSLAIENLFPLFDASEIGVLPTFMERLKGAKFFPAASPVGRESNRLMAQLPPQGDLQHRSQLLRIAAVTLANEFKEVRLERKQVVPLEERMVKTFEKLSNTEILTLSVSQLASKFGCSRRHLDRIFSHHFGISASAMKMEMRLLKAVSLLRDPDAKIINVASECGFQHLGLFNLRFKKRFGCTPGQWREHACQSTVPLPPPAAPGGICRLRAIGLCPDPTTECDGGPPPSEPPAKPKGTRPRQPPDQG